MKRIPLLLSACLSACLAAALVAATLVGALFVSATSASALAATGHAVGYLSAADGRSWLGSHALDDGNVGLCLEVTKSPPEGHGYGYFDGVESGLFGADDDARLAYFGRFWIKGRTDRLWVAATQLALWTITGLGAHDQWYYALRANDDRGSVLSLAQLMVSDVNKPHQASRSVSAKVALSLPSGKPGTVSTDLIVDFLNGGPTTLGAGAQTGTLTLTGAHFADGSKRRDVTNGVTVPIEPDGDTALSDVTADVTFTNLPYGDDFSIARGPAGTQDLLVPTGPVTSASAHAHAGEVSPLPFRPTVTTQASTQLADVGASVYDHLDLGLDTSASSTETPRAAPAAEAPAESPAESPTTQSPTRSPASESPTASPAASPASESPAASPASESPTASPTAPAAAPSPSVAPTPEATSGGAATTPTSGAAATPEATPEATPGTDALAPDLAGPWLSEWGVYSAPDGSLQPVPVTITSTLLGPFDQPPAAAATVPADAPVVCTVEKLADHGPGWYSSPDCVLPARGYYVWVDSIDPAKTSAEQGGTRVAAFRSGFAEAAETILGQVPPPPPVTPTPTPTPTPIPSSPTPPSTPSASPPAPAVVPLSSPAPSRGGVAELAETGRSLVATQPWVIWAILATAIGSAAVTLRWMHRRHRLGSNHERVHRPRR